MVYKFRKGSRVKGVNAQDAGEVLQKIRDRDGKLETTAVLQEAQNESSLIHGAFEWDDKKAGNEYRLIQARQMIRAITVVRDDDELEPAFVHVQTAREHYYQSAEVAVRNVEEWQLVRDRAVTRLRSAADAIDELDRVSKRGDHELPLDIASMTSSVTDAVSRLESL